MLAAAALVCGTSLLVAQVPPAPAGLSLLGLAVMASAAIWAAGLMRADPTPTRGDG